MIGNAVPVNLAKFLAESIKQQINENALIKQITETRKEALEV